MSTQFEGEWPFPTTLNGRMRNCAAPSCTKCKRSAVMIVRGITRLVCRLMDANHPDLAWLLRACHGADNSRAPHSVRQLVETSARRVVCGSPTGEASRDF